MAAAANATTLIDGHNLNRHNLNRHNNILA
jgi:hypothetical protein